ncbi:cilia- and flagella-associated protein 418 isoform X2 [Acipenser ruthenus]|uniref:cilia- and flagella-associated protein 418 isoform X2 n=1 Tax=Acipenser ruthenus TaxID=7906 RepID=UPI00155F9CC3|nr:cilia- and flagella-associated protein 418 isoform X2 [Acipenser ruthenus]
MADDLDELLDEVESKFCKNISVTTPHSIRKEDGLSNTSPTKRKTEVKKETFSSSRVTSETYSDVDIDDLIEELFDGDDSLRVQPVKTTATSHSASSSSCHVASRKTCNQLRCTACDFRVATFDDYEWDQSSDYLFFRNNMPDSNKLKAKLVRRRGTRAYACQCSWRSIQNLVDLKTDKELKWVCGKHAA